LADYLPDVAESAPQRRNAKIIAALRAAANMLEVANSTDPDLPEVMSVGINTDEITIQPWLPGAPVQAMRAFENLMTGTIERKAFPLVLSGAEQVSLLHSSGTVDGHTVVVSAATHRDTPVDGFLGVTEQTVAAIADAEIPIEDPADDLVLAEMLADRVANDNGVRVPLEQVLKEIPAAEDE
jgi:hypothetical protein